MSKPVVAVVGRPNVGKSTLFNRLIGRRLAIVEDTPGVTRDRIYAEADWSGREFAVLDTGGIEPASTEPIPSRMREQAQTAMETADVVLFLVDGREGLTAADREVAEMLRRRAERVILVVNKVDKNELPDHFYDFYELGLGEPVPVSAANMMGLGDLLDLVVAHFPGGDAEKDEDRVAVAVIGRPNVGKSSLINELLGEERVIVSDIAGTTRDAIDTPLEWEGSRFTLIDTAGIRRSSRVHENVEHYSVVRAIAAIERSDVCLVMIDGSEGLTEQDKKIAGLAHEAGKGIVLVVNKWDLVKKETGTMQEFRRRLAREMGFLSYAPSIFISVQQHQRVEQVLGMAQVVAENRALRVPTGRLNSLIADAVMMKQPPADKGRRLKIYYAAQIGVKPPLFSFQVNARRLMHFSYARYLENRIRDAFGFEGTSIKFVFREKGEKKHG
ncbi:MAG: ribosome biogenesis GTPase Der [Anaerovoracaceae bacterium]|jgi:GTP-binding protein